MPQHATRTSFKKGRSNPGHRKNRKRTKAGRAPGTPNVVTRDMREAIHNAFVKLGGEDFLVRQGKRDFRTIGALFRAVIPQEIKQAGHDPEEVATKIRERMAGDMDATTQTKPKEEKKK